METTREELCDKIRSIYPDIGTCGVDVDVAWDRDEDLWVVDLKKDDMELKTHLESYDVGNCMEGKECVHLGLQIAQLKSNIREQPR